MYLFPGKVQHCHCHCCCFFMCNSPPVDSENISRDLCIVLLSFDSVDKVGGFHYLLPGTFYYNVM